MEIIRLRNLSKVAILFLLILGSCSKDDDMIQEYNYHYINFEAKITAQHIGDGSGTFDPKAIGSSNGKLYICNGTVVEVFNAQSQQHVATINSYTKGETDIEFTNLTSIAVDTSST